MMFGRILGALVTSSLAVPALAEPIKLAPTSAWNVNYADDSCRLARVFGDGKSRTFLLIDRFAPADAFQLTLASKLLTRTTAGSEGWREITIRFGPGESEQIAAMRPASLQNLPALIGSTVVLGFRPDPLAPGTEMPAAGNRSDGKQREAPDVLTPAAQVTPAREAAVNYLEIRGASKEPIVLDLGNMEKPMSALRTCVDELLTRWGVDVEAHKSLTRPPIPTGNPGRWVTSNDYPSSLVARGIQGNIQFRLTVEADGKVSGCAIQQSTRPVEFDETVCRIMSKRARFDPALDADGKPIKSYWRSSFAFIIR